MNKLRDFKFRQWLYGVLAAVLVLLGGYGLFSSEEQVNILAVLEALLHLAPAAGFGIAASNARPSATDEVLQGTHNH